LAILALWLSFRAAKRRAALRASAQRLSHPGLFVAPAEPRAANLTSTASSLASCSAK
jgi:hypothetical protein